MNSRPEDEIEEGLRRRLDMLRTPTPRNVQKANRGREAYLAGVKSLVEQNPARLPVSASPVDRLNEWIKQNFNPPIRKERKQMFSLVTTLMVIVALTAGGAGTVYASQDSLPNDLLYPVKTMVEDVRLELAGNPQREVNLALAYSERRVAEIVALQAAGEPVPEEVAARLLAELDLALAAAAKMDDPTMLQSLNTIGVHIRKLERDMLMSRAKAPIDADPVLEQVRAMLRWQIGLVDDGLADPGGYRLRLNQPAASPTEPVTTDEVSAETPVPPGGFGPGPEAGDGTPTCGACTPVYDGSGPGPGPGNQGATTQPENGPGPLNPGVTTQPGNSPGPQATPPHDNPDPGGAGTGPNVTSEPSNGGGNNGGGGSGKP